MKLFNVIGLFLIGNTVAQRKNGRRNPEQMSQKRLQRQQAKAARSQANQEFVLIIIFYVNYFNNSNKNRNSRAETLCMLHSMLT